MFVSWSDLYKKMLDDFASGAWRSISSYSVAGSTVTYRSQQDFMALLDRAKSEAEKESGQMSYYGRTSARGGARKGRY